MEILVKSKRSDESCFGNVRKKDRKLEISFHQIQLGENDGTMEAG